MREFVKLSLADKLALIYTSAGSQRQLASAVGVSHQTIGRILHAQFEGRSIAAYEKRADLVHAIDAAFDLHKDLVRTVARKHQIPHSEEVPVYAERLALRRRAVVVDGVAVFTGEPAEVKRYLSGRVVVRKDPRTGEIKSAHKLKPEHARKARETIMLGERVGTFHLHWISDRLRDAWLVRQQKSKKFASVSVGSEVKLRDYNRQADKRAQENMRQQRLPRSKEAVKAKIELEKAIKNGEYIKRVYTPMRSMDPNHHPQMMLANVNELLRQRHQPATGDKNTSYASSILLQLDTRPNATDKGEKARDSRSARKRAAKK